MVGDSSGLAAGMPSLSQIRLRAERMNHKVIELQSDLRGIERRIRILESRAVGGNSRSVRRFCNFDNLFVHVRKQ